MASRWAFKEAVVKASGRRDLIYPQMYLKKEFGDTGKPSVILEDYNIKVIKEELKILNVHVSIAHEDIFSIAYVLLEK